MTTIILLIGVLGILLLLDFLWFLLVERRCPRCGSLLWVVDQQDEGFYCRCGQRVADP